MRTKDLRALPKVRDSWSYLYVERCRVDRDAKAICVHDERGKVMVPVAALSTLLLGPGTTITHAAVSTLADNGCLALWVGEQGVRFYAQGMGTSRSSAPLLQQVTQWADPERRMRVVRRLYEMRFSEPLDPNLTLQQVRGKEGARVRAAYAEASQFFGVEWQGRRYKRGSWGNTDPINRALSAANSALYGICHAAIVAAGYSTALGFIHTGKQLSFVYDVADLYKTQIAIPVAFAETAAGTDKLESRVRHRMRDLIAEDRLLQRIVPDLHRLLAYEAEDDFTLFDTEDEALPGGLWDPEGNVTGGINFASEGGASEDHDGDDT